MVDDALVRTCHAHVFMCTRMYVHDVMWCTRAGVTALIHAAHRGMEGVARRLIESKAIDDVSTYAKQQSAEGISALLAAASEGECIYIMHHIWCDIQCEIESSVSLKVSCCW